MRSQMEKAEAFRALHTRPGAFIIPNPWDAGTAKLLASMGFEALATTSLGYALTLGVTSASRDAIIANCRMIVEATDLPVSVDLENCGADEPKLAAAAIGLAAEASYGSGAASRDGRRTVVGDGLVLLRGRTTHGDGTDQHPTANDRHATSTESEAAACGFVHGRDR